MTMPAYAAAGPLLPPSQPPVRGRKIATGAMKSAVAGSLRKHADRVIADHPTMGVHTHLKDAARVLERGNTEGAQRHLNAAIGQLTPQSLQRHGVLTDEGHTAAKRHMDSIHRHLLLIKDIEDALTRNDRLAGQAADQRNSEAEARAQQVAAKMAAREESEIPGQAQVPSSGKPPVPAAAKPDAGQTSVSVRVKTPAVRSPLAAAPRPQVPAGQVRKQPVAASGQLGAIELSFNPAELRGPHGEWAATPGNRPGPPLFDLGGAPGSMAHINAIMSVADRVDPQGKSEIARITGHEATSNPGNKGVTATSLRNAAKSMAMRDMHGAAIHMSMASQAARTELGHKERAVVRAIGKSMISVPPGVQAFPRAARLPSGAPSKATRKSMYPPGYIPPGSHNLSGQQAAIGLSTDTPRLASTPHPFGSPSGPGLWHVKGMELPPYIQNIARALLRTGRAKTLSQAIAMAKGATARWEGGAHTSPEVRAASAATNADWASKQARAHAHSNISGQVTELAGFNPAQPRTPIGTWGGGAAPAGAAGKNQASRAAQKAALLKKAAGIRAQIVVLLKLLAAMNRHKVKNPKAAAAAAKKAAATKAKKGGAVRKPGARKAPKRMTRAQVISRIAVLRVQLRQTLAAAARL